jgi:hypothetical protein
LAARAADWFALKFDLDGELIDVRPGKTGRFNLAQRAYALAGRKCGVSERQVTSTREITDAIGLSRQYAGTSADHVTKFRRTPSQARGFLFCAAAFATSLAKLARLACVAASLAVSRVSALCSWRCLAWLARQRGVAPIDLHPDRALGAIIEFGPRANFVDCAQTSVAPLGLGVDPANVDAWRRHAGRLRCIGRLEGFGACHGWRSAMPASGAPVNATRSRAERWNTARGHRLSSASKAAFANLMGDIVMLLKVARVQT